MPDYNHFTTTIINSKYDNKYINKCKNYYNDAFRNNSKIFEFDFDIN